VPVTNQPKWAEIKNKPTTVAGYGISDMASQSVASAGSAGAVPWSGVSGKPTTVAGYGISDMASQSVASAGAVPWSGVSGKPTTVAGFGITDGKRVLQTVTSAVSTVTTGTAVIPADGTVPQSTEGDQYMTVTITPQKTTSLLVIQSAGHFSHSAGTLMSMALFKDAEAGARAASTFNGIGSAWPDQLTMRYEMTAGATSAMTFKIRAGCNNAGTTTFNGSNGGTQVLGGVNSYITVTEIEV